MKKIPTLFLRDPEDMSRILREVNPACQWVIGHEGTPTRKYDGTCVMFDGSQWWARREVKPDKTFPPGWQQVGYDGATGKSMGWEPIERSAFARYVAEALGADGVVDMHPIDKPVAGATYELVGPKVNGNPERIEFGHLLVRHGYTAAADGWAMESMSLDFDGIHDWLDLHPEWEGIVWHHPDGRMAKIKRRDFRSAALPDSDGSSAAGSVPPD